MKLSPVANSSDLDVARDIARRLHARSQPASPGRVERQAERPAVAPPPQPRPRTIGTPGPVSPPAAAPRVEAAPVPPAVAEDVAAPGSPTVDEPPPAAAEPEPPGMDPLETIVEPPMLRTRLAPAPPPWLAAEPDATTSEPEPPPLEIEPAPLDSAEFDVGERMAGPLDAQVLEAPASTDIMGGQGSWTAEPPALPDGIQEPEDALEALTSPTVEPGAPDMPAMEIEEPPEPADQPVPDSSGLEELTEAGPFELGMEAPPSPFEGGFEPPPSPFEGQDALVPAPDEGPHEELFDSPQPPSWGEIVETCMALAHASGALLADNTGKLVAVRGEWPDPGAEAIASRLVAMMERTLRDAPTRSVSAPVGAQHLTAWRVPVGDRLLTTAFLADAPVRAELRTPIDTEIQRGA